MRDYELAIIVSPNIETEGVTAVVEKVSELIGVINGKVTSVDVWGRRALAYAIDNHREGTYVLLQANMPPVGLTELERNLKLSEEIIRYLLVKVEG
jgi:small subunit ribosomal protein S6